MQSSDSSSEQPDISINTSLNRLGPIWLADGVTNKHVLTLFFASFFSIGILTIISTATNYILDVNLNSPEEKRGTIVGDLGFWTEVTQIVLFAVIGVLADKFGRRPIYVMGILTFGFSYALYPFAENLTELTIYRIIYAAGLAMTTGMLATVVADYPQNASRGKMVAVCGALNGLGVVVISSIYGWLPSFYEGFGYDPIWTGRYTNLTVTGLCMFVAMVIWWGLKPGAPVKKEERLGAVALFKSGFAEAKNPRIALSYVSAFVARSDVVVVGTFLTLWGYQAAREMGMEPEQAAAASTKIFVISQAAALTWTPLAGIVMDKVNRVTGISFCMLFSAVGFSSLALVDNPLDSSAIPFFIMLGIGQISAFLGSTILIGQEAPIKKRGSVVGVFNVCGAIGILVTTVVGGRLFDAIAPWAPFLMIGVVNLLLVFAGILIRKRSPGPIPEREEAFFRKFSRT